MPSLRALEQGKNTWLPLLLQICGAEASFPIHLACLSFTFCIKRRVPTPFPIPLLTQTPESPADSQPPPPQLSGSPSHVPPGPTLLSWCNVTG